MRAWEGVAPVGPNRVWRGARVSCRRRVRARVQYPRVRANPRTCATTTPSVSLRSTARIFTARGRGGGGKCTCDFVVVVVVAAAVAIAVVRASRRKVSRQRTLVHAQNTRWCFLTDSKTFFVPYRRRASLFNVYHTIHSSSPLPTPSFVTCI